MVRRTKQEALETKDNLLRSALETFCECGFSHCSLAQIAERIGLTRGAVYWHFKSKQDILLALAESMENRADRILQPLFERAETIEGVEKLVLGYARFLANDEQYRKYYYVASFRLEWTDDLACIQAYYQKRMNRFVDRIAKVCDKAAINGELRADLDIPATGKAIYAMIDGLILHSMLFEEQLDLEKQIASAMNTFISGMRKPRCKSQNA